MIETSTTGPANVSRLLAQMLLCSFLWGSSFLLMKLIGADLSPLALTAVRGVMGGGLLALWFIARGESIIPQGREWRDWIALGLLQGVIPNTLTAYALTQITAALTAMIQACTPLLVAVLAHLLFADEKLTGKRIAGVLIGFSGMALLLGPAAFSSGRGDVSGVLAMAATAVSYAFGNIYIRAIPQTKPGRLALGQQVFAGFPVMLLVLAFSGPAAFAAVPAHWATLAALGLFATAVPIVLYMHIVRTAGPTRGSMNAYLIPFWTILLGALILHEAIVIREIVGILVVFAGVAIVSTTGQRKPSTP